MKRTDKVACITIDLESDHAGRLPEQYDAWQMQCLHEVFDCLSRYRVPLSAFVVANTLEKNKKIIRYMQSRGVEFFLHSYSHDLRHPDSTEEIQKGVAAFQRFFKESPIGYRAPEGRISRKGYYRLHQNGFLFDSSLFPSFWPHPKYFFRTRSIHRAPHGITELPITTVSPARIIFSLSWVKLIGWKAYKALLTVFPLPDVVIFDFHLHDVCPVAQVELLPPFWRFVYRKSRGSEIKLLHHVLTYLRIKEYRFVPIRSLALHKHI